MRRPSIFPTTKIRLPCTKEGAHRGALYILSAQSLSKTEGGRMAYGRAPVTTDTDTYWADKPQESRTHKRNLSNGNSVGIDWYHLRTMTARRDIYQKKCLLFSECITAPACSRFKFLFAYLKGVFGDSGQAVVHVAPSTGVHDYFSDLVRFTQLRWPVWLNQAHQRWNSTD